MPGFFSPDKVTIFAKSFILDVWLGPRCASDMFFKERQNNCEILVTESFLETLQAKTNKWFLTNFWEKLSEDMISFTVIFSKFCKKVQNSCIPRESVWLYVKCLNVRNFVAKHAFLNSYSCTIIVNSIYHTGFPLHLGCFYHCNLGKFV